MTQRALRLLAIGLVFTVLGTAPFWPRRPKTETAAVMSGNGLIDTSNWKLTASTVQQRIGYAADGDVNTRWDSGKPQAGDEWIEIDLGKMHRVSRLALDQNVSINDYPRGYAVEVSDGLTQPLTQVAVGTVDGPRAMLLIDLPHTPIARIVRIRQTGQSTTQFWSVHEIYITGTELETSSAAIEVPSVAWRFWIRRRRLVLLALGALILLFLGPRGSGVAAAWLLPALLGGAGYYCSVSNLVPLAWTLWLWAGGLAGPLFWELVYSALMKELETRPYEL